VVGEPLVFTCFRQISGTRSTIGGGAAGFDAASAILGAAARD